MAAAAVSEPAAASANDEGPVAGALAEVLVLRLD